MWGKVRIGFITCNIPKISGEATLMVILVTDGVREGTLGMVTPSVARIKPRWRLLMHSLPYINATHQIQVWLW